MIIVQLPLPQAFHPCLQMREILACGVNPTLSPDARQPIGSHWTSVSDQALEKGTTPQLRSIVHTRFSHFCPGYTASVCCCPALVFFVPQLWCLIDTHTFITFLSPCIDTYIVCIHSLSQSSRGFAVGISHWSCSFAPLPQLCATMASPLPQLSPTEFTRNRGPHALAADIVPRACAIIVVGLRFYARRLGGSKLLWDDWLILFVAVGCFRWPMLCLPQG